MPIHDPFILHFLFCLGMLFIAFAYVDSGLALAMCITLSLVHPFSPDSSGTHLSFSELPPPPRSPVRCPALFLSAPTTSPSPHRLPPLVTLLPFPVSTLFGLSSRCSISRTCRLPECFPTRRGLCGSTRDLTDSGATLSPR